MDSSYVYLTAESVTISENGVNGTTRLYIGQYRSIQDNLGIPPADQITSPSGTQVIQGTALTVTADATDDVAVAAVNFLVNGQVVLTDTTPPYEFSLNVPANVIGTLTLSATAIDFGGNVGTAQTVTLNVIPDPLTTVTGRVIDSASAPVSGVTLTMAGGKSGTSASDGTFSIAGVPTIQGTITVTASLTGPSGTLLEAVPPTSRPFEEASRMSVTFESFRCRR